MCIPDARLEKVHAYLGCPNCGKSTTAPLGEAFKCGTCSRIGVISTPRFVTYKTLAIVYILLSQPPMCLLLIDHFYSFMFHPQCRITFNCEVSDDTGTYAFTTFTEDSERLFRMTAADLFRMKHTVSLFTSPKMMLGNQPATPNQTGILVSPFPKPLLPCHA